MSAVRKTTFFVSIELQKAIIAQESVPLVCLADTGTTRETEPDPEPV
jgi:hypothetical protein